MPRRADLIGRRFGHLTVIDKVDRKQDRYQVWKCQCDCGNTIEVNTKRLLRGTVTSCGCAKEGQSARHGSQAEDLTGRKFGRLTVLERSANVNGRVAWLCQCECGNRKVVPAVYLKKGNVRSCGCLRQENSCNRKDLTGQRFGRLVALAPTDRRELGSVVWRCRCDCGNEVEVSEGALITGNTVSCGCYKKEIQNRVGDTLMFVDGTCVQWLEKRRHRSDNTSGFRGVNLTPKNLYRVGIGFRGKRYYLGLYKTYEEAVEARLEAEKIMHDGYVEARRKYQSECEKDPVYETQFHFFFDVKKQGRYYEIESSDPEMDGARIAIGS